MNKNGVIKAIMMHVIVGGLQLGFGSLFMDLTAGCPVSSVIICATPLEGLLPVLRVEPGFSIGFIVGLATAIVQIFWNVFSFNYAMFGGEGVTGQTIGWIIRIVLAVTAVELVTSFLGNLLQSVRG